jgi:uncharacterized tellurite resistance protein B-like protein
VKFSVRIVGRWAGTFAIGALALMVAAAPGAHAQTKAAAAAKTDPAATLAATLSAACRHDETAFAAHLTSQTAKVFRQLPDKQRATLMARLALLSDAGKVLLSSGEDGRTVVRCEAGGLVTEMRFGAVENAENLAFVAVDVPNQNADQPTHSVRFGLVREAGDWRLLSVGLLMLDLPAMAQQWVDEDLRASEAEAVAALRRISDALQIYQRGFDRLPEALEQLGPAPKGDISPERAALLDESLAAGQKGNYRFRYVIVPHGDGADESERDKAAGFALAATPIQYGQAGRRSFYLDAQGDLRGADKHGAVATSSDPLIDDPRL